MADSGLNGVVYDNSDSKRKASFVSLDIDQVRCTTGNVTVHASNNFMHGCFNRSFVRGGATKT